MNACPNCNGSGYFYQMLDTRCTCQQIPVGCGVSTIYPDMDFESYSEAGYVYIEGKRKLISSSTNGGLGCVGAPVYSEHPSTEVLSLAYDLKDGIGSRLWAPGMPPPQELFNLIAAGGLVEAWNSGFEYLIWTNVCTARMGWPAFPLSQLRCAMAKAKAFSLPGSLKDAAPAIKSPLVKDKEGKRLLNKFSIPQNPTKKNPALRIRPADDPEDAMKLYEYNITDIKTEASISALIPDLSPKDLELWLTDQKINMRGVHVDVKALDDCAAIVRQAFEKYNGELRELTGGRVETAAKLVDLQAWLGENGLDLPNMQKETIAAALDCILRVADAPPGAPLPPDIAPYAKATPGARRALEIRAAIGSAAVKKLYAMLRMVSKDDRLRELFNYHKAHTGRFAGRGPQPQNLPNSGLAVTLCCCGAFHVRDACPACHSTTGTAQGWCPEAVDQALGVIASRDLDLVELYFADAVGAVSGCLRGLFCAAPGYELICSDYSAIEAVVIACLAGEQWRIDVFNDHGKIYEMSAAKITGIPFEEFMRHKKETGDHHPMRKKIGKVAELASAYQGGLGAWKQFGADKFMSDAEIEINKKAWRAESPMIVKLWFGLEDAARNAIQFPGKAFDYRGIRFGVREDVLYMRLLSGRYIKYHQPLLHPETTPWGKEVLKITFMGVDSKTGKWVRKDTYGGRLAENLTQGTAADIFTDAMPRLEAAGYPIVLHTHDEMASEVPIGYGSIEEYETIMATNPAWCADWPIRAAGGWRGKRYRKD